MPGPIQSAVSNAVGNIAQTVVDIKRINAQEKTAAELETTRKENAEVRDKQAKTQAISDFQNDVLAETQNRMESAMKAEGRKKKADRRPYSKVYDSVMGSVVNEYRQNPARQVQYGYSHGFDNPKTGKPYTDMEFAKALQDIQIERQSRLEGKMAMFFKPKANKETK